jgi:hypothetical protein
LSLLSHDALDASDRLGLDLGRLQYDMQSPEIAAQIRQVLADADTLNVMKPRISSSTASR